MTSGGYRSQFDTFAGKVGDFFDRIFGSGMTDIPTDSPKNRDVIASYVKSLWDDSNRWKQQSFRGRLGYQNPLEWFRIARLLEEGMHWKAFGTRQETEDDRWKQEIVDNEVGNQIRVKRSYMGGNWHDVTIFPNVKNISSIFDEERKKTEWTDVILKGIARCLTEGTAVFRSARDTSKYQYGVAREFLIDNEHIFPSPFSTGFRREDGCWYLIYASMITVQDALLEVGDKYKPNEFMSASPDIQEQTMARFDEVSGSGSSQLPGLVHTKLVDRLELWLDDSKLVADDVDEEEVQLEHEAVKAGQDIKVVPDQNDAAHIQSHMTFLEGLDEELADPEIIQPVFQYVSMHIQEHFAQLQQKQDAGIKIGKKRKYPRGRQIVVIGGKTVVDRPCPYTYVNDWRDLWHKWDCENVNGHFWGRGVPEILYENQKNQDTQLSRLADMSISVAIPKPYFDIADKDAVEEQGLDNNPLKPGFTTQPPVFRKGESPKEMLELFKVSKSDSEKQLGISGVTYGQSPGANTAAKLVQILLQQNSVIVTGEANIRLNSVIEDIVETRIKIWKQYYVQPRWYVTLPEGPQAISLSERMTYFDIMNPQTGKAEKKEIPEFQINIRPNSNFPQQWEYHLGFLTQLATTQFPDGKPGTSREAVVDHLAKQFPELGRSGSYYQISELVAIGQQAMAQQAAEQKQETVDLQRVSKAIKQKGMQELLGSGMTKQIAEPQSTGGANGQI